MIPPIKPYRSRSHLVDMKIEFDKHLNKRLEGLVGLGSPLQKFVDHEILRTIEPYTPKLTGTLIRSATIHTIIGSGEIRWVTPYSRRMYFENPGPEVPRQTSPLRGRLWIERWQNDNWPQRIMEAAGKKFGFGVKT
jgi:hypothetical protein